MRYCAVFGSVPPLFYSYPLIGFGFCSSLSFLSTTFCLSVFFCSTDTLISIGKSNSSGRNAWLVNFTTFSHIDSDIPDFKHMIRQMGLAQSSFEIPKNLSQSSRSSSCGSRTPIHVTWLQYMKFYLIKLYPVLNL